MWKLEQLEEVSSTGALFTLAAAKTELGIVDTGVSGIDDAVDAQVTRIMSAAQNWCEQTTYRTLREEVEYEAHLECWPATGAVVLLPKPPLLSITSVKYLDASDVEQTVSNTLYEASFSDGTAGQLRFADGFAYPSLSTQLLPITVTWKSGYGIGGTLPPEAVQAAALMLSRWYDADRSSTDLENYERSAVALLRGLQWGEYV